MLTTTARRVLAPRAPALLHTSQTTPNSIRAASTTTAEPSSADHKVADEKAIEDNAIKTQERKDTIKAETLSDEEIQRRMAAISGDGGESGVEYEDGQPVAMKRSVKNNMFRYI